MDLSQRLAAFERADLYVVITASFCAGRTSLEVLARVLDAGVGIVQLREKDLGGRDLYELALAYRQRTAAAGALLIIDDRLDLALATGADGVHLGQADLPVAAARRVAPNLVVGVSCHSLQEATGGPERRGRLRQYRPDLSHRHQAPRRFPGPRSPLPHRPASEDSLEHHGRH